MALEGTIKDFGLPDIFQLIGLQRKTGILTLKGASEQVTVTFENGMVVMADTSAKRLEDRLGSVLVKQGRLTPERLEESLLVQKQTLQRLGHVLVASGVITSKDLKEAVQVQVSQIVFRLFRWKEGEYHFAPTDSVDYDREHFNPMSADFILMEGVRMVDEWPIIEKKISSMDIVFRTMVDRSMIDVGGGGEDVSGLDEAFGGGGEGKSASPSNRIRLTAEEERVFRRVDGNSTVQTVVDASGLGEFDTCRILFDLLNRNIIAPAGRGTARAAAVQEAAASPAPGYAVLALAIVLALAGLAARLGSPFGVVGMASFLGPTQTLLMQEVARARLDRLDKGIVAYVLARGASPETLQQVVDAGLVAARDLGDLEGHPFAYSRTASGYHLSAGGAGSGSEIVIDRRIPAATP